MTNVAIYRCGHCGVPVAKNATICPHCYVRLAGIVCTECHFIGNVPDFPNDRCPRCGSHVVITHDPYEVRIALAKKRTAEAQAEAQKKFSSQIGMSALEILKTDGYAYEATNYPVPEHLSLCFNLRVSVSGALSLRKASLP